MTRDDIIRLAEEAGFECDSFGIGIWDNKQFNKFANLVAAAERKKFCSDLAALHDVYSLQSVVATRARGKNE